MSYATYKLIHFLGVFALLAALAATAMHASTGGTRAQNPYRRPLLAAHAGAAFLVLLGGFGLLARIGVMHGALPGWVFLKLGLWATLGLAITVPYRNRSYARLLLILLPLLALAGGAIAISKPAW